MFRRVSLAAVLLLSNFCVARIVPPKHPLDGVLDAELVVLVKQSAPESRTFTVEEVFLGSAKPGQQIELKDFQLETIQSYGPPEVDPMTPNTRILLYLRRMKKSGMWEPTFYKHSYFWVQSPKEANQLQTMAVQSVRVRRGWESAARIKDPEKRVAALWPFLDLMKYHARFFDRTVEELKKCRPTSGAYFARRFKEMSHFDKELLLSYSGEFGSEELHQTVKSNIVEQQHLYEQFVRRLGRLPKQSDWQITPSSVNDATGEIYNGMAGLIRFRDRADLAFIREVARWTIRFHQEQTAEEALKGFALMPDSSNLPVIEEIRRGFSRSDELSITDEVHRALCAHNFEENASYIAAHCR